MKKVEIYPVKLICKLRENRYICSPVEETEYAIPKGKAKGEVVEWSITAVLKTVELKGSGGSNPSLSAIKGVNQVITRFTPFITPKK